MLSRLFAASSFFRLWRPSLERFSPAGEQSVALALDEGAVLAGEASVLAAPDFVEGVAEVAQDVKLVEHDAGLRRVALERVAERTPHVHHRELDAASLLRSQRGKELIEVLFATTVPAEPDRPRPLQVADDDAVLMPFPNGDLVHANRSRRWRARAGQLLLHVELVEVLHRAVVQMLDPGHRLVGHVVTELADLKREALRVARILHQPVELLYEHGAAPRTPHAPALELEVDTPVGDTNVAHPDATLVIAASATMAAARAARCFFRRRRTTTRAKRSPKTPLRREEAMKPGSENRARNVLGDCTRGG